MHSQVISQQKVNHFLLKGYGMEIQRIERTWSLAYRVIALIGAIIRIGFAFLRDTGEGFPGQRVVIGAGRVHLDCRSFSRLR